VGRAGTRDENIYKPESSVVGRVDGRMGSTWAATRVDLKRGRWMPRVINIHDEGSLRNGEEGLVGSVLTVSYVVYLTFNLTSPF
jgi:hypothetical protein